MIARYLKLFVVLFLFFVVLSSVNAFRTPEYTYKFENEIGERNFEIFPWGSIKFNDNNYDNISVYINDELVNFTLYDFGFYEKEFEIKVYGDGELVYSALVNTQTKKTGFELVNTFIFYILPLLNILAIFLIIKFSNKVGKSRKFWYFSLLVFDFFIFFFGYFC